MEIQKQGKKRAASQSPTQKEQDVNMSVQRAGGASSKSSDKTLAVLELLAAHRVPMRLQDISAELNINQTTVLRYLTSLIQNGYAYQEEYTLRYGLSMKICRLGEQINTNLNIRTITAPYLNQLSNQLDISSCVVVEREHQAIYVDVVEKPGSMLRTLGHIGHNAPLNTIASGKIFLSSFSEVKLNEYLDTVGLSALTSRSIVDREAFLNTLNNIRVMGWSLDDEECDPGFRCVSVPLYGFSDTIIAALSVFDEVENMSMERICKEILPALHSAQCVISSRMGSSIKPTYSTEGL